ncbi:MAG: hypothetical protein COB53_01195 [Elusimicrobia bacterium]|nr:MAG: hypothetical protein COB53_01195 [Elusimicrobiota bacterium]
MHGPLLSESPELFGAIGVKIAVLWLFALASTAQGATPIERFLKRVGKHAVPLEELHPAVRAVGDIHALGSPKFWTVEEADRELDGEERVLGLRIAGEVRAYPIRILNHHEVVNDRVGGKPVVITYCPLCLSGIAFERTVSSQTFVFDVSGLLYNSDLVLFDRATSTLWSQILGEAIVGPLTGTKLVRVPLRYSKWRDWKKAHPETRVLSFESGGDRNYYRVPYKSYHATQKLRFPVKHRDRRLPNKQVVFGISLNGKTKAYPLSALSDQGIRDYFNGVDVLVWQGKTGPIARRLDNEKEIRGLVSYWFAWAAFNPGTELYGR